MAETVHDFLPYGRQCIDEADIEAVSEVLRGERLTTGPAVDAFESAFAQTVGCQYAVSCNSGTAALHLAALAGGLEPDTAAIVPAVTFVATANAARFAGAEVIFSDVDPDTGLMEAQHLREALDQSQGQRIKAVFPVHLNGQCADLASIRALANEHELTVIEDACHAVGTSYDIEQGASAPIGSCVHADFAAFSFHPVKTIAMGEGGAITTSDSEAARRLQHLRSHGITRTPGEFANIDRAFGAEGSANPWYYEMSELGFNYRASDIQCALGLSQLRKLDQFVARRRALVTRYDMLLEALAPTVRPVARRPECQAAWHLYAVRIDFPAGGRDRAALMHDMHARGIGTQVHFIPVYMQPYYRTRYGQMSLPGAEAYYTHALTLPLYPTMTDGDVDRVVDSLAKALGV